MKKRRLDAILIKRGLVTEEQLQQALMRQRARGGGLGGHLLFYRYLSPADLAAALAEQFGVKSVDLSGRTVPDHVLEKIPTEVAEKATCFPFAWDEAGRVLSVAMADPEDKDAAALIARVAVGLTIKAFVAPEHLIRTMIDTFYRGRSRDQSMDQIIELPNLFVEGSGPSQATDDRQGMDGFKGENKRIPVLMLSDRLFYANLLPSIFEREGYQLTTVRTVAEALQALRNDQFERILVSTEIEDQLRQAAIEGVMGGPMPEISVFESVSAAMLDTPAPYRRIAASLIRVLHELAELRLAECRWKPPYALISADIEELGSLLGLHALARDGLQAATHLIVPSRFGGQPEAAGLMPFGVESFGPFAECIRIAASLDFPWDIAGCLRRLESILRGVDSPVTPEARPDEIDLAAQCLAIVWYRYAVYRDINEPTDVLLDRIRTSLHSLSGSLVLLRVVDAYIEVIERTRRQPGMGIKRDIVITSDVCALAANLPGELRRHGFRTVVSKDLEAAEFLIKRRTPAAVLLSTPASAMARDFVRSVRSLADGQAIGVFAVSADAAPTSMRRLVKLGFNDVFTPPFGETNMIARISEVLASLSKSDEQTSKAGLQASFRELSFLDLVQALSSGRKSVRLNIEYTGTDEGAGEKVLLYLRDGRIVYGRHGNTYGAEAVYRVIAWRDEGSFHMELATEYPPDNIDMPNDYILLEGCRILDEGDGEVS